MEPIENVPILDINGEKLCEIHCPQTCRKFVGQSVTVRKWANPEVIIFWAWYQAFEANKYYRENGMTNMAIDIPTAPCLLCKTESIKPAYRRMSSGQGVVGIQCENQLCTMYHVIVPWQMVKFINEVPSEHIPIRFGVHRTKVHDSYQG
jgi:hypothetical protein